VIPYLLFFCVAGIPAMFPSVRPSQLGWAAAWVVFVLFIGLRHHVGGDWEGYLLITQRIKDLDFLDAARDEEMLFSMLTWVSAQLGFGVYGVNLVGAAIFCSGLFAYCSIQSNRWLALATAVPFLVIVAVMSANRQGMAIGVVLWVMSRWGRLGIRRRALGIAIAALFHASAAFLLVFCVIDLKISKFKKVLLLLLVTAVAFWLLNRSEIIWQRYTSIYTQEKTAGVYSPGAIFHLLLNLFPAVLMLVFSKRWSRLVPDWPLLRQLCWMAIGLLVISPFYTVAVSRMSLYLFPISISFFSSLPRMIAKPAGRALARLTCVIVLGGVLVMWLAFANTAFTYRPYDNVLTMRWSDLALPQ
jgi:hypothetical protein